MDTISSLRSRIRVLRDENRKLMDIVKTLELDRLTHLPNRSAGERMVEAEIDRSLRSKSIMYISAAFVDINNLKYFNDKHGHTVGDAFIRAVAEAITETKRAYDIAYRFGGDEFVIILPDVDSGMAKHFAVRLSEAVSKKRIILNGSRAVKASAAIGLHTISNMDFDSVEAAKDALINCADRDMYINKNEKRDVRKGRR